MDEQTGEPSAEAPNTDKPRRRRRPHPDDLEPEDLLTAKQYAHYRNGRMLSVLLTVLGYIFIFGGVMKLTVLPTDEKNDPPRAYMVACIVAGAAGVVGGTAALRENRAWARVGYLFAIPLMCGIPIGTLVSIFWMLGLPRYLAACDRIRQARAEAAE